MRTVTRTATFAFVGVCLGAIVWFGLLKPVRGASQEKSTRPLLTKLPPIKNCTEHVKLVKAELLMWGDSQVASLEVENMAYVGVISISIEHIRPKFTDSVVQSGFTPDNPPNVIIPPGGRKTLTIGNLEAKALLRIGGVMFADGEEEGCRSSLKSMHELKDYHTKKGGSE